MSLLVPDLGLLFWMLLSFRIVFFVVAKFGFPVITRMVNERKAYIDESLRVADEANRQLANIKAEGESIRESARAEQLALLRETERMKEQILADAKEAAQKVSQTMQDDARKQIRLEKEAAMADIRSQVALLAVEIAEQVLRGELQDKKTQIDLIDRLLDEAKREQADA